MHPHEAIYLPPNGVNVHYAKTESMARMWPQGLAHPRTYITHKDYRLLLFTLVFCEWTDERKVTRYYGFTEHDASDIIENKHTEDVKAGDPVLIVPLSQMRDEPGSFYEQLSHARKRCLAARTAHDNRKKGGDGMAPFLVFFASVARHDDPVAAETLLPIECIARAALVAHEHDEEKRRKAMELLAQQKSDSVQGELTAWLVDIVCDVITFGGVFGYEAYRLVDYVVFLLARAMGTGIGRILSACLGDNAYMCLAIVILDLLVAVGTVLAPFMLGFSGAAIAVAVSSATGEAKARCKSSALDWLLGSLSNQMVRIVSTLLQKVAFSKDVDEIVAAATSMLELKNIWNLGASIVLSELFSQMDGFVKREINKRLNSLGGRLAACFVRLAVHYAISKAIETMMNTELGGMYRRMLVPKWMNIAVMGAESAKAEEQRKLLEVAAENIKKGEDHTDTIREANAEVDASRKKLDDAREAKKRALKSINNIKERAKGKTSADDLMDAENDLREAETLHKNARYELKATLKATMKLQTKRDDLKENHPAMKYYNERKAASDSASQKATAAKSKASELDEKRKTLADAELENPRSKEKVDDLRKKVNEAEQQAAKATEESRIADEKDRYRNAAVRDREQKGEYAQASRYATKAREAEAKTEPSFMRKTLTGLAEWWTGNSGKSSEKTDSGMKMGMAHFV
jgi:hypothetical protein